MSTMEQTDTAPAREPEPVHRCPPDAIPRLADDVAWIPVDRELLLHREHDGTLLHLDEVGALVLSLVDSQRSVSRIVDHLNTAFDVPRDRLAADVDNLLAPLMADGVLMLEAARKR